MIQNSNKKDNLQQATKTNGVKNGGKNQKESVQPKSVNISTSSVAPSESPPLSKVCLWFIKKEILFFYLIS